MRGSSAEIDAAARPHVLDAQLGASTAAAWVSSDDEIAPSLADECRRIGASLTFVDEGGARALRVTVSHAETDAFGLFFLLSHFGRWRPAATAIAEGVPLGRALDEAVTLHAWCSTRPRAASSGDATVTQRLLRRLLPVLAAHGVTHASLVVARASAQALAADGYRRNGFMPVDFDVQSLLQLSQAPRHEWKAAIEKRAERIERLAAKSPALLTRSRAQVMISAAGEIGRFGWIADAITPERTQAVATPWRSETFNLFTWSRGERHAMSLCGDRHHPLHAVAPQLFAAWETAHDEP
jgi:hypothetical protein